MKTKLLRKLRNEAYKAYGIKTKLALHKGMQTSEEMDAVYIIGHRLTSEHDVVEFRLKDAKNRLNDLRIGYCIKRVSELRESYRISRLNKL